MNWFVPWEPSYLACVMAALALAAFLHKRGRDRVFFGFGAAVVYFALHTHFDYYAEHSFFMHRVQQSLLHHIGPFLLVLGGARFRLCGPIFNAVLFFLLTVLWLIPSVHTIAMLDWRIYCLMNWSMATGGVLFWSMAFDHGFPMAKRVAMLLSVMPLQIVLGALLFFSPHELYAVYELCGRVFAGLSAHDDQQLGALVIWLCGPMMSTLALLLNIRQQIKGAENENPYDVDEMPVGCADSQALRGELLQPAPEP